MKTFLAVIAMLGLVAAPAMAAIEKGNSELGLSLSLQGGSTTYTSDFGDSVSKKSMQTAMFSYGYFMSQKSQIGAMVTLSRYAVTTEGSSVKGAPGNGNLGFFYKYHFIGSNPKMVPYAGIGFTKGFIIGEDKDNPSPSEMGYGVNAGLKAFMSEKTAIGPELRYDITKSTLSSTYGDFSGTGSDLTLALNLTTLF